MHKLLLPHLGHDVVGKCHVPFLVVPDVQAQAAVVELVCLVERGGQKPLLQPALPVFHVDDVQPDAFLRLMVGEDVIEQSAGWRLGAVVKLARGVAFAGRERRPAHSADELVHGWRIIAGIDEAEVRRVLGHDVRSPQQQALQQRNLDRLCIGRRLHAWRFHHAVVDDHARRIAEPCDLGPVAVVLAEVQPDGDLQVFHLRQLVLLQSAYPAGDLVSGQAQRLSLLLFRRCVLNLGQHVVQAVVADQVVDRLQGRVFNLISFSCHRPTVSLGVQHLAAAFHVFAVGQIKRRCIQAAPVAISLVVLALVNVLLPQVRPFRPLTDAAVPATVPARCFRLVGQFLGEAAVVLNRTQHHPAEPLSPVGQSGHVTVKDHVPRLDLVLVECTLPCLRVIDQHEVGTVATDVDATDGAVHSGPRHADGRINADAALVPRLAFDGRRQSVNLGENDLIAGPLDFGCLAVVRLLGRTLRRSLQCRTWHAQLREVFDQLFIAVEVPPDVVKDAAGERAAGSDDQREPHQPTADQIDDHCLGDFRLAVAARCRNCLVAAELRHVDDQLNHLLLVLGKRRPEPVGKVVFQERHRVGQQSSPSLQVDRWRNNDTVPLKLFSLGVACLF